MNRSRIARRTGPRGNEPARHASPRRLLGFDVGLHPTLMARQREINVLSVAELLGESVRGRHRQRRPLAGKHRDALAGFAEENDAPLMPRRRAHQRDVFEVNIGALAATLDELVHEPIHRSIHRSQLVARRHGREVRARLFSAVNEERRDATLSEPIDGDLTPRRRQRRKASPMRLQPDVVDDERECALAERADVVAGWAERERAHVRGGSCRRRRRGRSAGAIRRSASRRRCRRRCRFAARWRRSGSASAPGKESCSTCSRSPRMK